MKGRGLRAFSAAAMLSAAGWIAGCATSAPRPPATTLDEQMLREITPQGVVPWSATRQLVWADYRAKAPADPGADAAVTAYSLFWGVHCTRGAFAFQVVAGFFPDRSWVRPAIVLQPDTSRRTLRHEQTHFDVSEVYARRMRRFFQTITGPCLRTNEDLTTLGERFVRDESDMQRRYDEETANGRRAADQQRWDADIAKQLVSLDAFHAEPKAR